MGREELQFLVSIGVIQKGQIPDLLKQLEKLQRAEKSIGEFEKQRIQTSKQLRTANTELNKVTKQRNVLQERTIKRQKDLTKEVKSNKLLQKN